MLEYVVMTNNDLDDVLAIENEVALAPWSPGIFKDCLNSSYIGFLLKENNELLGFSMMSIAAGECHLLNIAIKKAAQHKGYGRKLLEFIIEEAKDSKASQIFLEVRISNTIAQSLYLSMGFNELDCRKNYYPNDKNGSKGREDALIFALELMHW